MTTGPKNSMYVKAGTRVAELEAEIERLRAAWASNLKSHGPFAISDELHCALHALDQPLILTDEEGR